jgi:hypothetical protein
MLGEPKVRNDVGDPNFRRVSPVLGSKLERVLEPQSLFDGSERL